MYTKGIVAEQKFQNLHDTHFGIVILPNWNIGRLSISGDIIGILPIFTGKYNAEKPH